MTTPPAPLDIERPDELAAYLERVGLVAHGVRLRVTTLYGGVSNKTMAAEHPAGHAWVVKQALARLRVATPWFCDPSRIGREASGLRVLERVLPSGSVPHVVHEDAERHVLVMTAVPRPHTNWKNELLAGRVDTASVQRFGELLGTIHLRTRIGGARLPTDLWDRSFFETLRIEPYYLFTASRHPSTEDFFGALVDETLEQRLTLVHGDYSPKNVLVHAGQLVLLDHEVAHVGDPAFDVGFALTHLLAKANHRERHRGRFGAAAHAFWERYASVMAASGLLEALESRAVRHAVACLLARVDGRSPLEYLDDAARVRQRRVALQLVRRHPPGLTELIDGVVGAL